MSRKGARYIQAVLNEGRGRWRKLRESDFDCADY